MPVATPTARRAAHVVTRRRRAFMRPHRPSAWERNAMPTLFGASYDRADLMRRVGRFEQVAGVRLVTAGDGIERGIRLLEFRTGTGFAFDIVVDRAFDIGRCEM